MTSNNKEDIATSSAVVDVDEDGYIKLLSGESDNIITQLGRHSEDYKPWKKKIVDDINYFTSHVVKSGYYPAEFGSSYEFIQSLRDQATTNPYVDNYVEQGMDFLVDYLNNVGIADESTKYLCIDNNSDLTDITHTKVSNKTNSAYNDIIRVKDQVDPYNLFVPDNVNKEIKKSIEPIIEELRKVDSYYSFEDLSFSKDQLKYISGFTEIDFENMNDIDTNDEIILFSDVFTSGFTFIDVYRNLRRNGYENIICFISLIKQV